MSGARMARHRGTEERMNVAEAKTESLNAQDLAPMLLKIHLGCGPHKLPGWVNCDKEVDIRRPLPFPSSSAECMLAEHVLEHVSPAQGWSFLEEAFRVLAPGSTLHLIVPSL